MKNNLVKLLTSDKKIRLYIVDTTDILVQSKLKDIKTDFAKELYKKIFTGIAPESPYRACLASAVGWMALAWQNIL